MDFETETLVAHSLRGGGFDASEDGTGRGTPIIPLQDVSQYAAKGGGGGGWSDDGSPMFTLQAASVHGVAMCYRTTGNDGVYDAGEIAPCLNTASDPNQITLLQSWRVRRLMPVECERLQGFPDDYTAIPYGRAQAKDGPRYKALGNSMAVNVMRWIGRRIEMVEAIKGGGLLDIMEAAQ